MTVVSPFDSVQVLEVLEVLVANKEDEIHLAVDQKQPHAERVLHFNFPQLNKYTLWDTRVMKWNSRNPCVQQIQDFHGSNIQQYFCSPKNLGLLFSGKTKIFCLCKYKQHSITYLIDYLRTTERYIHKHSYICIRTFSF